MGQKILKYFFNVLILFLLVYDISINAFPSLTSGRLVVIWLIIFNFKKIKSLRFDKDWIYFISFILLILSASLIQFIYSGDFIQSSRIIWFTIYVLICPILVIENFSNLKYFLESFLIITVAQSIIAITAFINPEFKNAIMNLVLIGGNDVENVIYRAISFTSTSGAALSVIQFCGIFSGLLLVKYFKASLLNVIVIWLSIFLTLLSTLIIGRTGLLLSLLVIIIFIISTFNIRRIIQFGILVFIIFQIDFISVLESQTTDIKGFKVEFFLNWLEDGFTLKDNNTVNTLNKMPVPELSVYTMLGTGMVFNKKTGKNESGNDSGYIQTYYSLGFILSLFFYTYLLIYLLKKSGKIVSFNHILILLLFLIEFKEPFIFKYVFPFYIVTTLILYKKSSNYFRQERMVY